MKSLLEVIGNLSAEISPPCFTYFSNVRSQIVEWFTSAGGKVSVERDHTGEVVFIDRHRNVIRVSDTAHLEQLLKKHGR